MMQALPAQPLAAAWTAMRHYAEAWSFVRRQRLTHYYLYPLVIALGLQLFSLYYIHAGVESGLNLLMQWLGLEKPVAQGSGWELIKSWLLQGTQFLLALAVKIYLFFTMARINRYLTLMLVSPVLAFLSERCDTLLTGRQFDFSLPRLLREMLRGVLITLRNAVAELFLLLVCVVLSFVFPPLGLVLAPLMFFISAYYMGFSMMDYICERHGLGLRDSVQYVRRRWYIAVGNGTVFSLLFLIPVVGAVLAPVLGTVAACLSCLPDFGREAVKPAA
jgi:CysZ protein